VSAPGRDAIQRTAIVTGAGSGIGAAVSRALGLAGIRVMLSHPPGVAAETAGIVEEIRRAGGAAAAAAADAGSEEEVRQLVCECRERLGPPDIVVANAGVATRVDAEALSQADFEQLLRVDLLGVHYLFRAALGSMRSRGWGRLLATASTSGHLLGWAGHAAYCAAKAGVVGLVRAYAVEFGAAGITANAVAPGIIETPQSRDPVNSLGEDGLRDVARLIPSGRVGGPADVAGVFAFLCSDSAAYVNGQAIVVDGGLSVVEPI
jgi:3-oxoacyl-[acyl-carrier protein] reductase